VPSGTTQSACPNRIHTAEVVGSSPAAPASVMCQIFWDR